MYDVNKSTAPENILKLFWLEFVVFILTIHVPQPLNIFIPKHLD